MSRKRFYRYMMSVLAYYRSEWTDISDDDTSYRLFVTTELEHLIKHCMKRKTNIPNAAKEVEIFLELQGHNADAQSDSKPLPKTLNIDFSSLSTMKDIHIEPEPQESEDDADA